MTYPVAQGEFPELKPIQSFGAPRDGHPHYGIDIANGKSFKCLVWKNGRLEKRPYNNTAGYSFWIYHDDGTKSLYCHITKESFAGMGNGKVKAGQAVAVAGRTGNATGICIHYEYHIKGEPVNPIDYFNVSPDNMTGIAVKSMGQVQAHGAPELINDAGNKSGTFAGPGAVIPFDAIRTSKWPDKGGMEFHNIYLDKGSVWIHINDITKDDKGNPLIIWGHVEPEKTIIKKNQKILEAYNI
jgi:hypothetical protein